MALWAYLNVGRLVYLLAMTQASNQDSKLIGRFYSLFAVVFPALGAALYGVYCSTFQHVVD